jgi:hypothetical protein
MYKVQDYNMECHCKWRLDCTDEILWLEVELGGSLDKSIGVAFVVVLVIESIDFQIVHWVFERYYVVQNLEL